MAYQHLFTLGFKVNDGTSTDWRYRTVTIESNDAMASRSELDEAKVVIKEQFDRQDKYDVSYIVMSISTITLG